MFIFRRWRHRSGFWQSGRWPQHQIPQGLLRFCTKYIKHQPDTNTIHQTFTNTYQMESEKVQNGKLRLRRYISSSLFKCKFSPFVLLTVALHMPPRLILLKKPTIQWYIYMIRYILSYVLCCTPKLPALVDIKILSWSISAYLIFDKNSISIIHPTLKIFLIKFNVDLPCQNSYLPKITNWKIH